MSPDDQEMLDLTDESEINMVAEFKSNDNNINEKQP